MARVTARLREIFEAPEAAVYLVATGTAANALALACLCPPWATVYCHREAHVAGGRVRRAGVLHRRRQADADRRRARRGSRRRAWSGRWRRRRWTGVHNVQKGALSLTNATEAGTVYAPGRGGGAGRDRAGRTGVPVHMDGARFANALVALGCTPAELTWKAGVDVLSFGGTKNGCLGVEAVMLFDPARAWEFELRRKRGGHLFSKHRYLSAQMEGVSRGRAVARAGGAGQCPGGGAGARHRGGCRGRGCCIRRRRTRSSPPGRGAGHRAARAAGAAVLLLAGEPEPGRAGGRAAGGAAGVQLVDRRGGRGGLSRLLQGAKAGDGVGDRPGWVTAACGRRRWRPASAARAASAASRSGRRSWPQKISSSRR